MYVWYTVLQILAVIYSTHNGISEMELHDLVPELTETVWSLLCYVLLDYLILTSVTGLLVFANEQVGQGLSLCLWLLWFITVTWSACVCLPMTRLVRVYHRVCGYCGLLR